MAESCTRSTMQRGPERGARVASTHRRRAMPLRIFACFSSHFGSTYAPPCLEQAGVVGTQRSLSQFASLPCNKPPRLPLVRRCVPDAPQLGFGWSNGVVLWLLSRYGGEEGFCELISSKLSKA